MLKKIECTIFRGGTSKGVFFMEHLLPPEGRERDEILLGVMGSPDIRQIDGLGGSVSTTSKAAIISASGRDDADVDYTFAQVSVDKPIVDYKGNCGNISSAVGPYAIEMGLVRATRPETLVRIYNTNTKKIIHSQVETPDGKVNYSGDFTISGVPGGAARIRLSFMDPAGAVTGKLLPTGNPADRVEIQGLGVMEISIVDATNPLVFVKASDIGLEGTELPEEIDNKPGLLDLLENIRGKAAFMLGFVDDLSSASFISPAVPKMTLVSGPSDYMSVSGQMVSASDIDMTGRMMSMQKTHKTYALTGALCTAAAAVTRGTVVNNVLGEGFDPVNLRIGHPGGVIPAGVEVVQVSGEPVIKWAIGYRTARMLMHGTAYYR